MPAPINVKLGERFGRLVIVGESHGTRKRRFDCLCDCGQSKNVALSKLRSGNTQSCGCLQHEIKKQSTRTHGQSKTRIYRIWVGMKARCLDPRVPEYSNYGGRGISVCSSWMNFESFQSWASTNGYNDDLTIERKDNDGNYDPENCEWIPKGKQGFNTRKSIAITYDGRTMILKEWARVLGIRYLKLYKRIVILGWSAERAFST
jgi:hypothetical protein